MSQEDNELEKLKAKRLAEMEKNLSSQKQQKELQSSQEEEKKNQPTHREIVVKRLGYRGLEVLQNAEYQFPKETQIVIQKLAELISSGHQRSPRRRTTFCIIQKYRNQCKNEN